MLILNGDGTITGNPDITLTESVSIAGTVTYEDVTSIDAVGVVTARSGVNVTGGTVTVGADPNDGVNVGTKLTTSGVVQATRSSGSSAVFMGYTKDNSTPRVRINGNGGGYLMGDVGIGTDTGIRTTLDLGDGQLSLSHRTDYSIRFYNGLGNNWSSINNPRVNDGTNASELAFKVAQGEAIRIATDTKVGINSTSPKSSLDVGGTVSLKGHYILGLSEPDMLNIGGITASASLGISTVRIFTSDNVAVHVNSDGEVTKPLQPGFIARYSVAETTWTIADGWTKISWDEENMDRGNNFNTTTSTFTAPVAGMYLFGCEMQLEFPVDASLGSWMYVSFVVNGQTTLDESKGGTRTDINFEGQNYNSYAPTHLLQLNKDDTVAMYRTGGGGFTSIKFKGGGESVFWGYLVG